MESIADRVEAFRKELDDLPESDVQQTGQPLNPARVDRGLELAARMMVRRMPAAIAVHLDNDDGVGDIDAARASSAEHRISRPILLLGVVEEAISSVLLNGHAAELAMRITCDGQDGIVLTVDGNGTGPPEHAPTLHCLSLLSQTIHALGGAITLAPGPLSGARLATTVRFCATAHD